MFWKIFAGVLGAIVTVLVAFQIGYQTSGERVSQFSIEVKNLKILNTKLQQRVAELEKNCTRQKECVRVSLRLTKEKVNNRLPEVWKAEFTKPTELEIISKNVEESTNGTATLVLRDNNGREYRGTLSLIKKFVQSIEVCESLP